MSDTNPLAGTGPDLELDPESRGEGVESRGEALRDFTLPPSSFVPPLPAEASAKARSDRGLHHQRLIVQELARIEAKIADLRQRAFLDRSAAVAFLNRFQTVT